MGDAYSSPKRNLRPVQHIHHTRTSRLCDGYLLSPIKMATPMLNIYTSALQRNQPNGGGKEQLKAMDSLLSTYWRWQRTQSQPGVRVREKRHRLQTRPKKTSKRVCTCWNVTYIHANKTKLFDSHFLHTKPICWMFLAAACYFALHCQEGPNSG